VTANHEYQLSVNSNQLSVNSNQLSTTSLQSPISNSPATAEWNIIQINADDVWTQHGITGTGVLVASIDSGVQYNHPALVNQYAGNTGSGFDHSFHWYDATTAGAAGTPYDDNGHGTHTMGTIAGGDGPGPFADDIGVAPGANWISVKAFSAAGTGLTGDIHAAFEWILAPCPAGVQPGNPGCDPAKAPAVVNNSWGNDNGAYTEFLADVQALRAAGIWPEFSAGNNGSGAGTIGSPGSFAESFATGATDSNDLIASFSSRGPSPLTNEIKPDVVAPGVGVRSSVPGGGYNSFNGTSMASPHSTGLAALMLSAAPNLDLDAIENIMRDTAVDLGPPGPDMDYGYGRIDA
jgi:bacillopeptidase F